MMKAKQFIGLEMLILKIKALTIIVHKFFDVISWQGFDRLHFFVSLILMFFHRNTKESLNEPRKDAISDHIGL